MRGWEVQKIWNFEKKCYMNRESYSTQIMFTDNRMWFCHYKPQCKRQSMENKQNDFLVNGKVPAAEVSKEGDTGSSGHVRIHW